MARGSGGKGVKGPWFPDSGFVFFLRQYLGFSLAVVAAALLIAGYDRGWMSNNQLSLLCLGIVLVGLLVHESRPFKRWENITEEVEQMNKEGPNPTPQRRHKKDQ
ncbi:unnamed protein product [Ostreobium quekettii]|uniref:Uncharacterized protein n=1 Tax=Ostreobium quekettii TaxID=121088 RepID=A0A8S1JBQ4_9CHLO|nr:unnamed protein product [Ostreobium quekettii]|eukprot:evm.model.scf_18.24 EVM.evm.TU.scf_18.24   scf_18:156191-157555(+)